MQIQVSSYAPTICAQRQTIFLIANVMAGPMNIDQENVPHESSQFSIWDDLKRTFQNYSVTSRFSFNLKRKDAHRAVYVCRSCFGPRALKATLNDEGIIVIRSPKAYTIAWMLRQQNGHLHFRSHGSQKRSLVTYWLPNTQLLNPSLNASPSTFTKR